MDNENLPIVYPTDKFWCDDGCGWHYSAICPNCGIEILVLFTGFNYHNDYRKTEDCKPFNLVDLDEDADE